MDKMSVQQAAEKWNISIRRVQDYCRQGKIPGAERFGLNWSIPSDATKPADGRSKSAKAEAQADMPMPRKSPFLDMTNLYSEPGTADECILALASHPEAQALFAAEIAYRRGEVNKVYRYAQYLLERKSGFYAIIAGGMLLSHCALWTGDVNMFQQAKKHICEATCHTQSDRDIVALSLAVTDSSIRSKGDYPDWFTQGRFDTLPTDAHHAARVYYAKNMLVGAQEVATGERQYPNIRGLGMIRFYPYIVEPMITKAHTDKTVMPEIYLRLLCAIAYSQSGDTKQAKFHIDKAVTLCLPDRLYGPLVEYRRQLGKLLDERIAMVDPDASREVKELHKQYLTGWTIIHNTILERNVSVSLTVREREIARLAVFGLSDRQIAEQLKISEASVKGFIRAAKNKTGVDKRSELVLFI